MKASAVFWSLVLMIVAICGFSGCGGSNGHKSSSHKSTVQRVQLTKDDIPDVMEPGIWPGIKGAYREGNSVTIRTAWSDTTEHRSHAESAALAAAGDLGYVYSVTVYGDMGETLGSWTPR